MLGIAEILLRTAGNVKKKLRTLFSNNILIILFVFYLLLLSPPEAHKLHTDVLWAGSHSLAVNH